MNLMLYFQNLKQENGTLLMTKNNGQYGDKIIQLLSLK